jgi:lipopolysaccharide export system protein LptC
MTASADAVRDRRRRFAAPGGSHDHLIQVLGKALPTLVGLVAAVMILSPLKPRGEVSFLLDRHKVAMTGNRIDVDKAMYRGNDNDGRPFEVTAGHAVQKSPSIPVIVMQNLLAKLQLQDGPARVEAPTADYNYDADKVSSQQPLTFTASGGYRMTMSNVTIDLNTHLATGSGGVQGILPAGSFTADQVTADLGQRTVALVGRAHLHMTPGKMSVPK